jgi:hypothetical protein
LAKNHRPGWPSTAEPSPADLDELSHRPKLAVLVCRRRQRVLWRLDPTSTSVLPFALLPKPAAHWSRFPSRRRADAGRIEGEVVADPNQWRAQAPISGDFRSRHLQSMKSIAGPSLQIAKDSHQ